MASSTNESTERAAAPAQAADQDVPKASISRRTLCLGVGASAVMLGLGAAKLAPAQAQVRPPGAQDEDRLLGACVRCGRCVEACPHHAITLQHMEDGILGMRTPVMDFSADYCTGCADEADSVSKCELVCPTGAISLPEDTDAASVVIGLAVLDTEQCLAYRLAGCRFCYDACPFQAIELQVNDRPVVVNDRCTGCGACESVCVSLKEGSIQRGATERAIHVVPVER